MHRRCTRTLGTGTLSRGGVCPPPPPKTTTCLFSLDPPILTTPTRRAVDTCLHTRMAPSSAVLLLPFWAPRRVLAQRVYPPTPPPLSPHVPHPPFFRFFRPPTPCGVLCRCPPFDCTHHHPPPCVGRHLFSPTGDTPLAFCTTIEAPLLAAVSRLPHPPSPSFTFFSFSNSFGLPWTPCHPQNTTIRFLSNFFLRSSFSCDPHQLLRTASGHAAGWA